MIFGLTSVFGNWGLVGLLAWLALLFGASYSRHWLIAAALNAAPVLCIAAFMLMVNRLERNEATDQSALGAVMMAGLAELVFIVGLVATALGAVCGIVLRAVGRNASLSEEN